MKQRPASLVTLAYLVLTLPLLWRGAWSTQRTTVALPHLVALGLVAWSLRPPPAARRPPPALADWVPLLLIPFLYAELPYLMGDNVVYHDALVRSWEASIFGGQPSRTLASLMPHVAISELLHLGYLSYYAIVYVPPLLLYLAGRRDAYRRTVLAMMLTYAACFTAFVLFPVEGPRYSGGAPPDVPGGPIRWLTLAILERGSSRGTAFPSSHAAVAAAQAIMALRFQRRVGAAVSLASALLMIGAVYGGFHYAVDILAGAVVGLTIALVVGGSARPARAREDPGSSGPIRPQTTIPDRA